jgi:hypothetical protein
MPQELFSASARRTPGWRWSLPTPRAVDPRRPPYLRDEVRERLRKATGGYIRLTRNVHYRPYGTISAAVASVCTLT